MTKTSETTAASEELEQLLAQLSTLPWGRPRSALLEQIVERAEAELSPEQLLSFRLELVAAYHLGGESHLLFAPFARCLADVDADPTRFGKLHHSVLWQYKYVVFAMTQTPQIGRQQIDAALDDLERRWREAGASLHAVYRSRWWVAFDRGDQDAADEFYRRWTTTPYDDLCEGFIGESDEMVWHLEDRSLHRDAVELGRRAWQQSRTAVGAAPVQTALLRPLVLTGDLAAARDAHQRSYRVLRTAPDEMAKLGEHLRFATLTGNLDRGRELYERHVHELRQPPLVGIEMTFLAVAARFLSALAELDPDVVVPDEFGVPSAAATLSAQYAARARELAMSFDARNATSRQSRRIENLLTEAPWVDGLPLLLPLPAGPAQSPAKQLEATARVEPTAAHPPAHPPEVAPPVAPDEPGLESPDGDPLDLVDLAMERRDHALLHAAMRRFDETPEPEPWSDETAGRVWFARSRLAAGHDGGESPADLVRRSIVAFEAAGDLTRLNRSRATLSLDLLNAGEIAEAVATGAAALDWLIEQAGPGHRFWAAQRARLDLVAGHEDRGYERVAALAANPGDDAFVEAQIARMLARLEYDRGRFAECVVAATAAMQSDDPVIWRAAHSLRADAKAAQGDTDGALEDQLAAVAGSRTVPDRLDDPLSMVKLADKYLQAGRASEAAEAGEVGLRLACRQPDDDYLVDPALWTLQQAYEQLGAYVLALGHLRTRTERIPVDQPLWRAEAVEDEGKLLAALNRWTEALPPLAEAADAYHEAGEAALEVRSLRRAWECRANLGDLGRATELNDRALVAVENVPADDIARWFHQGGLYLQQAYLLSDLGEAEIAYRQAEESFTRGGLGDEAREASITRMERIGADLDEVRGLFVDADERSELWYRAGWVLADLLDRADRGTEAEALRAELQQAE